MKNAVEIPINISKMLTKVKDFIPALTNAKHKGEYGRIGVVGGCVEYTGAPYFAAMTALKCGADIVHVFCQEQAASVIKCYSPDLIVHPILGTEKTCKLIEPWLSRLHVIVIGPGIGCEVTMLQSVKQIIEMCQRMNMPMIIDADGLSIIKTQMDANHQFKNMILTPNAKEFRRLFGANVAGEAVKNRMSLLGGDVTILVKGSQDKIYLPKASEIYILEQDGSGRRCGGQGDMLSGALAIFFYWARQSEEGNPSILASFAASYLTKECNKAAFKKYGRSMLTSDMLQEIYQVFNEHFSAD